MTFKSLLKDSESVELKIGLLCSSSEGGLLQISLLHAGVHLFFTMRREGLTVGERVISGMWMMQVGLNELPLMLFTRAEPFLRLFPNRKKSDRPLA